jgi:hypothetical protein
MTGGGRSRPLLERVLDAPQRLVMRLPWPPNGRIAVQGIFGFLKQLARSRSQRLTRRDRSPG